MNNTRKHIRGGLPVSEYNKIHKQVIKKYGNASKCESTSCNYPNPKRFEWALKKGHQYSENIEDYLQLCPSCHRKYDFTEKERENKSFPLRGELGPRAKLNDCQVMEIYSLLAMSVRVVEIAGKYGVSTETIADIKRGDCWVHLYKNQNIWKYQEKYRRIFRNG